MIVCNILNIDNIDVSSDVIPEDGTERQEMFEDICKRVVQLVWPKIDMKSIQQAAEDDVVQDSDSDVNTLMTPSSTGMIRHKMSWRRLCPTMRILMMSLV